VPTLPVIFALLAGVSAATWTLCLKVGSTKISVVLGALVVSSGALAANAATLAALRGRGQAIDFRWEGLWVLALAGVAAAGVDIFTLLAYERGLRISSSLIVSGTSMALVLLVGFLALHEPVTWTRVLALGLIASGILLLQAQGG
jgi:drug/metabolite transporter (DMT)-like permease